MASPQLLPAMNLSVTETFLRHIYGDKPDNTWLLVWTLPDKKSYWYENIGDVTGDFSKWSKHDVYVGCCLAPHSYGSSQRCKGNRVAAMPGLWADIDIAGEGHKKANLPPDQETAISWIRSIAPDPSLIVWSGHGLQCWWRFDTWPYFGSGSSPSRDEHASISTAWSDYLRREARKQNWDIDATGDLARVLRLPGTLNQKSQVPIPAIILSRSDVRYSAEAMQRCMGDEGARIPIPVSTVPVSIVLSPDATMSFTKWDALIEIEPKALQTWLKKRKDLQDQSQSGYDMSLAHLLVSVGWTDQEITDALVVFRRKYGEDVKRADYYARTILRAGAIRTLNNFSPDYDESQNAAESQVDPVTGTPAQRLVHRQEILDMLSVNLTVVIKDIVCYLGDPPDYRIITELGDAFIGPFDKLQSQQTMRNILGRATRTIVMPKFKAGEWDKLVRAMLTASRNEDRGDEATDAGAITGYLKNYFVDTPVQHAETAEERRQSASADYPYVHENKLHFFMSALQHWIYAKHMERLTARELGASLRLVGCESAHVKISIDSGWSTKRVWFIHKTKIWNESTEDNEDEVPK